ncbi:MAG TPA: hypothetical protein VNU97_05785 [Rhizomicrobium sp.]|jgi:hypothetical protein|nr:hypothetical protein [Rhizomicrobium sp.]
MREPEISNTAQQRQDKPAPAQRDERANSTLPRGSGAVHGGEAAKPGQMDGDEDVSPDPPKA